VDAKPGQTYGCEIRNLQAEKSGQILQVFFLGIFREQKGFSDRFMIDDDRVFN